MVWWGDDDGDAEIARLCYGREVFLRGDDDADVVGKGADNRLHVRPSALSADHYADCLHACRVISDSAPAVRSQFAQTRKEMGELRFVIDES